MPRPEPLPRRFHVRALHSEDHHGRVVDELSFEAAAAACAEAVRADVDGTIRVVVHDVESGDWRCFRIDLPTGESDLAAESERILGEER